jgi:hypothetical protein
MLSNARGVKGIDPELSEKRYVQDGGLCALELNKVEK